VGIPTGLGAVSDIRVGPVVQNEAFWAGDLLRKVFVVLVLKGTN